ncbi:MAG: META domain-containing protein [Paludibacteraceae bacterium]|nr:META domain-containing protein [Paludibacteraceae bacterium]
MKKNLVIVAVLVLIFSSCASRVKEPVFNFQGKMLHLVEINGETYNPKSTFEPITFMFTETAVADGSYKMNGHSGCNQLFGQYRAENGKIKFSNMGMTRRMCDEESNKIELKISQMFETANAYKAEKGKVTLYNGQTPLAVFEVK